MEFKRVAMQEREVDMDARTISGYAATWDIDQGRDKIHPGAFAKSIKEAFPAKRIKMLWQHWQPLGMPTEMREDDKGLFVTGRVSKTALGDEALELIRDEVVDSFSIGFVIPAGKSDEDDEGVRHIREVKLLEFSPVTFPMNEAALITGVKEFEAAVQHGRLKDGESLMKALAHLQALAKSQPAPATAVDDESLRAEVKEILDLFRFATAKG